MTNDFRILPAGDSALIVEFEERIDAAINARAVALADAIQNAGLGGVRDVVPTYRSVAIYFDPLHTDLDALSSRVERDAARPCTEAPQEREPIRIPVCYGGPVGSDLEEVARFASLTEADVIAIHSAPVYRVFMLGFVPGFAYMGPVDPRIAVPRRSTPRLKVPAGSVGIAGAQTGIYPSETPGGWQLVGRTPFKPFDLGRADPFLMKAGDTVQFYPISANELEIAELPDRRIAGRKGDCNPAMTPRHVVNPHH